MTTRRVGRNVRVRGPRWRGEERGRGAYARETPSDEPEATGSRREQAAVQASDERRHSEEKRQ